MTEMQKIEKGLHLLSKLQNTVVGYNFDSLELSKIS